MKNVPPLWLHQILGTPVSPKKDEIIIQKKWLHFYEIFPTPSSESCSEILRIFIHFCGDRRSISLKLFRNGVMTKILEYKNKMIVSGAYDSEEGLFMAPLYFLCAAITAASMATAQIVAALHVCQVSFSNFPEMFPFFYFPWEIQFDINSVPSQCGSTIDNEKMLKMKKHRAQNWNFLRIVSNSETLGSVHFPFQVRSCWHGVASDSLEEGQVGKNEAEIGNCSPAANTQLPVL